MAAVAAGADIVLYGAFVLGLALLGRRDDARALAGFIPDCLILFHRLLPTTGCPARASCSSSR